MVQNNVAPSDVEARRQELNHRKWEYETTARIKETITSLPWILRARQHRNGGGGKRSHTLPANTRIDVRVQKWYIGMSHPCGPKGNHFKAIKTNAPNQDLILDPHFHMWEPVTDRSAPFWTRRYEPGALAMF